jgi:hypothetical protein
VHVRRFAARRANGGLHFFAVSVPDVAEEDLRAFLGERFRFRRALSARPAIALPAGDRARLEQLCRYLRPAARTPRAIFKLR